jgi:mannose-6-phosphate isomerase
VTALPATRKIAPDFRAKIWGARELGPWFPPQGEEAIGEVWFSADDLLIKFLFTSQKLSVQVHPDDAYARQHENSRGKTEMWHILRADPGAQIALGFREPIERSRLIPAAESGAIMDLLNWIDVRCGDTYFVSPGTVHAIGAGLALCEIQQNSDITYRLYDYGRKREMHLRQAQQISDLDCHPGKALPEIVEDGVELLAECSYFRTFRAVLATPKAFGPESPLRNARLLVVLEGSGRVNGLTVQPGEVLWSAASFTVEPETRVGPGQMTLLLIE